MLNVVVMVSGGGTNLQAIIDNIESGQIRNARIAAVISNNANAYALERAKSMGFRQCAFLQRIFHPGRNLMKRFLKR